MPMAKSFGYEGAVGLGIVAAMSDGLQYPHGGAAAIAKTPRAELQRRSEPIPILSSRSRDSTIEPRDRMKETEEDEEEEADEEEEMMSESYTCVISHVDGDTVRKKVYVDDGGGDFWGYCTGVFFNSPPPTCPPAADFLSRCFRCSKQLHGIDIFIYRGERAFCSEECRRWEIASEERGKRKRFLDSPAALDCSASPCSAPVPFSAGVTAA